MIWKLTLLCMLSFPVFAQDLKVLSWNTYMLPKPLKFSNQKTRTKVIADSLSKSDYDLMFFQESFTSSFRNHMKEKLKSSYPYSYYLKNNRIIYPVFGSGVFVMSKNPFKVVDKIYFKDCKNADCFAAKGSVLIESKLKSGRDVQFAVTHLQAAENLGSMRLKQFRAISGMLEKHKRNGVPQILVGDLNTDKAEPEFELALSMLGMDATPLTGDLNHTNVIDCYKSPGHEREWIDHFWVTRDGEFKDTFMEARSVDYSYKGKVCNASDHYAVEGKFTFAD